MSNPEYENHRPQTPLEKFQARIEYGVKMFPDYSLDVAINRADNFCRVDRATRDKTGKLLDFSIDYTYENGEVKYKLVNLVGFDLRCGGWVTVFARDITEKHKYPSYEVLPAVHLTPAESDHEENK